MNARRHPDGVYLVIDQGGHATRALVYDRQGELRAQGWQAIETRRPAPGWVEHDAKGLLDSIRSAVTRACRELDVPVLAAGLATQRSTIVCWDRRTGAALSPALSWQDTRNAGLLDALAYAAPRVRAVSGLPLSPHYGASKLRWCLDELPTVRRNLEQGRLAWGPLASFLLFGLLDERPLVCDPANAARTLLWDLAERDWSDTLLTLFDLPRGPLPTSVDTAYPFGTLRTGSRAVPLSVCTGDQSARSRGIPLRVCTGDQSAVPFAMGWPDPETVFINVGTGAFVQRCTGNRRYPSDRLLTGIVRADGDCVEYTVEGTVNGAGAALDVTADDMELKVDEALARIDLTLDSLPLFLNGIGGLGSPWWRSDFHSTWIGEGDAQQRFQAVFESVLFLIQSNLDELERAAGGFRRIVVGGGFSRQPVFVEALAGLSGRPVTVPGDPELTARGVAMLLAGDQLPRPELAQTQPAPLPRLRERYRRWRATMEQALV